MTRRVVVTGLGMISPLGHNVEQTWDGIKAGKSGIGPITHFDPTNYLVKIAAEVKGWDAASVMPAKEIRRRDRYQHYSIAAAKEAGANGGFAVTDEDRSRAGVIIGSAVGGVESYF